MSCTKRSSDFVGKSYRDHNVNREVGEFRSDDRTQLKNYELSQTLSPTELKVFLTFEFEVLPFKLKLFCSTFTWYCLFSMYF